MEIKHLKETLATLMMNDLELLGVDLETIDDDDEVQLYTTTDDYCEDMNEVTWISSVHREDLQFLIIAQGTVYDEEAAEETGRDVEVGRLFVDENKAEMLADALYHSFPEIVEDTILNKIPEEEDEEDPESREEIDDEIGRLKKRIIELEGLRKQYEKNPADSDRSIDLYQRVKKYAGLLKKESSEVETIKRKNTVVFVSGHPKHKVIKITEANVGDIVNQSLDRLPPSRITKTILVDKQLAKALAKTVKTTFK